MKISEMVQLLQKAQKDFGDREVVLVGHYGAEEKTFEICGNQTTYPDVLRIWTDICTG